MNENKIQHLIEFLENSDRYRSLVEDRLREAGKGDINSVYIDSIAKYWPALEKLAAE